MIGSMSLEEIRAVSGGSLSGMDAVFTSVSIDTRTLEPGDLFIALTGPNFNGNDYVGVAEQKQAVAAIVTEDVASGLPALKVKDARKTLGVIGSLNRSRSTARIIAMTGSQGKTTVKGMTAAILANCTDVFMTQGNLNNDLGVPLSLASIEAQHEFAVIELGANGPGEIAYTAGLTRPDIAHITNIAGTHLEGFGSLDGVASAKSEIWQGIVENGTAVINIDDSFADQFIDQISRDPVRKHIVTVSGSGKQNADFYAGDANLEDFRCSNFTLVSPIGEVRVSLKVAGRHNINNAVAAAAMAISAGAGLSEVKSGLESFVPVKGRMCVLGGLKGAVVIDDTYNASPSSFHAAIDVLEITAGTTIVVMGDMGELGDEAKQLHSEVGLYARNKGVDHLIAVGELSGLAAESFGENAITLSDRESFLDTIQPLLDQSVTVLVKGSRSQGMEDLVRQIQAGDV